MHSVDEHKDQTADRRERAIGAALLVLGLPVAGGALVKIQKQDTYRNHHVAQAQTTAPADQNSAKPEEAEPACAPDHAAPNLQSLD